MHYSQEITDAIHGSIIYSGIEREIIGTPFFNRLHRILQSSMVYMTFPSNQVKRFEHSLGTMHLAGDFFFYSVCNSTDEMLDRFFREINKELTTWNKTVTSGEILYIHSNVALKYKAEDIRNAPYPKNRLYSTRLPGNLKPEYRFPYFVIYQSIRLVGMLHDVGHLPYSHVLEYSMQLLYRKVRGLQPEEQNEAHKYFLEIMSKYCEDGKMAIHEELGTLLVRKIFESIIRDLPKGEDDEIYFFAAVRYFTEKILSADENVTERSIYGDLHRIVAGTVDCDRMDYCCRDAFFAGTSKDIPNYQRIIGGMKIVYRKPEAPIALEEGESPDEECDTCIFTPASKSVYHIERLLEQRWDIFSAINYHHRVHKHELLLEGVIAELGLKEMESGKKPETIKKGLPLEVSSIWQLVKQMDDPTSIEYIALQLDDSWLDTLLKQKYFDAYGEDYLSFKRNGVNIMWHRMDELISSKKHYLSLIKRSDGFRQFDELLWNQLADEDRKRLFDFPPDKEVSEYTKFLGGGEFAFNAALKKIASQQAARAKFFEEFETRLNQLIHDDPNLSIADCLLGDCSFKVGLRLGEQLYISDGNGEKPFSHYSDLYWILMDRRDLLPGFHLYFLPAYDTAHEEYAAYDLDVFRSAIAKLAAAMLVERLDALKRAEAGKKEVKAVATAPSKEPAVVRELMITTPEMTPKDPPAGILSGLKRVFGEKM